MPKLEIANNYNFKGSDELQEVIKSKEYKKYKKEQDLKLKIAATKKLSKERSQHTLTQVINLLSSQKKKGYWFERLTCENGTIFNIQASTPTICLDNLASHNELEIMICKEVSSTNLKALKGITSNGVYAYIPITKVLELIKDNSE